MVVSSKCVKYHTFSRVVGSKPTPSSVYVPFVCLSGFFPHAVKRVCLVVSCLICGVVPVISVVCFLIDCDRDRDKQLRKRDGL